MSDFLTKILEHKRGLLLSKKAFFDSLKKKFSKDKFTRNHVFKKAISKPGQVNLIAEIKKASPSAGLIAERFDLMKLAKIYAENGAVAYSILTEEKYFLGKPMDIKKVSESYNLPILTKDFIIDEGQLFEAFYHGASAVLLIAAILTDSELKQLITVAAQLDMDPLVEIHNEKELQRALKAKAETIGINNRDLHTFKVDVTTSHRIIPKIPKGKIIVAESGLKTHKDIETLKGLGAHAVLIGETFLKAPDVAQKMREVMFG